MRDTPVLWISRDYNDDRPRTHPGRTQDIRIVRKSCFGRVAAPVDLGGIPECLSRLGTDISCSHLLIADVFREVPAAIAAHVPHAPSDTVEARFEHGVAMRAPEREVGAHEIRSHRSALRVVADDRSLCARAPPTSPMMSVTSVHIIMPLSSRIHVPRPCTII